MNITSEITSAQGKGTGPLWGAWVFLLLTGCLPGPWDYVPESPVIYRGLFVTAYAIADRPLERVCFERVFNISEESTQAFPFYENAQVEVEGDFGNGIESMTLTPIPYQQNCFWGRNDALVRRGKSYELRARINWDSAGVKTETRIRAKAQVPSRFSMAQTAEAPAPAFQGGSILDFANPDFLESLPEPVRNVLLEEFGPDLLPLLGDSVALEKYLQANGARILARTLELVGENTLPYNAGDTLSYLPRAASFLSHFFKSERSEDVGGVLISQPYNMSLGRSGNSFTGLFGEPDTAMFFLPGNIRRLIFYPDVGGQGGRKLLDRMGVVNAWFFIGPNRLYFYGIEPAYAKYMQSAVEGEEDSRVIPIYNALEGKGIFVGAVKDSFDLHIVADSSTKVYPMEASRDAFCRNLGWLNNPVCRDRYPSYCREKNWVGDECAVAAVTECIAAGENSDTLGDLCSAGSPGGSVEPNIREEAERRYCVPRNFNTPELDCSEYRNQCHGMPGPNPCKNVLWEYCQGQVWLPEQCQLGLVSFCSDRNINSPIICREARKVCSERPDEILCR